MRELHRTTTRARLGGALALGVVGNIDRCCTAYPLIEQDARRKARQTLGAPPK